MDHRSAQTLCNILAILIAILGFSATLSKDKAYLTIIFVIVCVLLAAGIFITYRYSRCPHCHKMLPLRSATKLKYCPNCSKKLDSDD